MIQYKKTRTYLNFWQFKVPSQNWANDGSNEYEELEVGSIFPQYIKLTKKLNNCIGDVVFYYNSKKSKKYGLGIYLVCKIHSNVKHKSKGLGTYIELEVIKNLKNNPIDYSIDFPEIHNYYNTTKIRKRAQSQEIILEEFNPIALYKYVIHSNSFLLPEEISQDEEEKILEGAKTIIKVNSYERSDKARKKCIEHYGTSCYICGFNFENFYGDIGKNFIHVHHLKELSEIKEEYEINPIKDLRPVCPNCHAMLHKKKPAYKIEEIKEKIQDKL